MPRPEEATSSRCLPHNILCPVLRQFSHCKQDMQLQSVMMMCLEVLVLSKIQPVTAQRVEQRENELLAGHEASVTTLCAEETPRKMPWKDHQVPSQHHLEACVEEPPTVAVHQGERGESVHTLHWLDQSQKYLPPGHGCGHTVYSPADHHRDQGVQPKYPTHTSSAPRAPLYWEAPEAGHPPWDLSRTHLAIGQQEDIPQWADNCHSEVNHKEGTTGTSSFPGDSGCQNNPSLNICGGTPPGSHRQDGSPSLLPASHLPASPTGCLSAAAPPEGLIPGEGGQDGLPNELTNTAQDSACSLGQEHPWAPRTAPGTDLRSCGSRQRLKDRIRRPVYHQDFTLLQHHVDELSPRDQKDYRQAATFLVTSLCRAGWREDDVPSVMEVMAHLSRIMTNNFGAFLGKGSYRTPWTSAREEEGDDAAVLDECGGPRGKQCGGDEALHEESSEPGQPQVKPPMDAPGSLRRPQSTKERVVLVGRELYIAASYFNHSCRPNCFMEGGALLATITAARDISPGEELAISYIDEAAPLATRRSQLRREFYFHCTCERCLEDAMRGTKVSKGAKGAQGKPKGHK